MQIMTKSENDLIEAIDDKSLADLFLPAIKEVLKAGGGADQILKQSEVLAAMRLSTSAMSGRPDLALKAATEILNRTQGKAVERHLNIYADVSQMSEEQLAREIKAIAARGGARELIEVVANPRQLASAGKRRPGSHLNLNLRKKKKEPVDGTKPDGSQPL